MFLFYTHYGFCINYLSSFVFASKTHKANFMAQHWYWILSNELPFINNSLQVTILFFPISVFFYFSSFGISNIRILCTNIFLKEEMDSFNETAINYLVRLLTSKSIQKNVQWFNKCHSRVQGLVEPHKGKSNWSWGVV